MPSSGLIPVDERTIVRWLFLATAVLFLLLQQAQINFVDGLSMYHLTEALVTRHSIQVIHDPGGIPGIGGSYSKYGVALPVISIPAFVVGDVLSRILGHTDYIRQAVVASTMPLICAALAGALYLLARRLGGTRRGSLLVAVGALVGTYVLPYTKDFFSEPLTALALVMAFDRVLARRPVAAGAALAVAILARPQEAILVPVLFAALSWRMGWRGALKAQVFVVAALVFQLGYDQARFGSPVDTGYGGEGFSTPIWVGLAGLAVDPSKSLFLFAPAVVLLVPALAWLRRRDPVMVLLLGANLLLTLVLAATWHSWEGGWSWGPRLLIPGFVPAMAAIAPWASERRRMRWVAGLFLAGFLVNASTLIVGVEAQIPDVPRPFPGPGVLRQLALVPGVVTNTLGHWSDPVVTGAAAHTRFVNLWQVGLIRLLHRGGMALAAVGTVGLALLAALCGRRLAVEVGRAEAAGIGVRR